MLEIIGKQEDLFFMQVVEQLRLGGQIPPRHASVDLSSDALPTTELAPSKAEPAPPEPGMATQKTWVIAIGVGIFVGVLGTLVVMLLMNQ